MKPPLLLTALAAVFCLSEGVPCTRHEFWSSKQMRCMPCSACPDDKVVLTPCQGHRDTQCVPISGLEIDWSWIRREHHLQDKAKKAASQRDDKIQKGLEVLESYRSVLRDREDGEPEDDEDREQTIVLDDAAPEQTEFFRPNRPPHQQLPTQRPNSKEDRLKKKKALSEEMKALKKWLIVCEDKLKHKKDDLMKDLKKERAKNRQLEDDRNGEPDGAEDPSGIRLNQPIVRRLDPLLVERLLSRGEEHAAQPDRRLSTMEIDIFRKVLENQRDQQPPPGPDHSYRFDFVDLVSDPEHASDTGKNDVLVEKSGSASGDSEDKKRRGDMVAFSAAEKMVWDWQAVALTSAVVSCLVFFAAAALYIVLNARHWTSVNKRYDTDLDEMSSRMALMQSPGSTGGGGGGGGSGRLGGSCEAVLETTTVPPPTRYLHHLIEAQSFNERKTNVYIDDKQLNS